MVEYWRSEGEESLFDLKDVFKRLVAMDIYFDIKNNPNNNIFNRNKSNSNNQYGNTEKDESEEESVTNDRSEKSDLQNKFQEIKERSKTLENEDQESVFSKDNAFTELSSNLTNMDDYLEQMEDLEKEMTDNIQRECFVKYIVRDALNLNKLKMKNKFNYLFFNDPLVVCLMEKYRDQNEDINYVLQRYFHDFNKFLKFKLNELYKEIVDKIEFKVNDDLKKVFLNVMRVLGNELGELTMEFNALMINLYESRFNLNEIYSLISYYNLNLETLSIDIKTIQYALRMDELIINYFKGRSLRNILDNLNNINQENNKFNYAQFRELILNNIFMKSDKLEKYNLEKERRRKLIGNLVHKNVYGIGKDLQYFDLHHLEPVPLF